MFGTSRRAAPTPAPAQPTARIVRAIVALASSDDAMWRPLGTLREQPNVSESLLPQHELRPQRYVAAPIGLDQMTRMQIVEVPT